MNIRIRRHERSRGRLRQQNRISLHLPEGKGSNSEEDHVVFANRAPSHHKSTHAYTEHTTLTSVAICVIVNHQKPTFLVNIADKTDKTTSEGLTGLLPYGAVLSLVRVTNMVG